MIDKELVLFVITHKAEEWVILWNNTRKYFLFEKKGEKRKNHVVRYITESKVYR